MREILFRGKRKRDRKWGYGWYCGKTLTPDMSDTEECSQIVDFNTLYWHVVDPETVGQFTGLTDKYGKKIFEGDVVKAERICNGKAWQGIVVWWNGCFAIQGIKDSNVPAIDLFVEYEIIGNIHDDKELLHENRKAITPACGGQEEYKA